MTEQFKTTPEPYFEGHQWHDTTTGRVCAACFLEAPADPIKPEADDDPKHQAAPRRVSGHDVTTLMLCVAGAWAHGTISRGRALELAQSCGWDAAELEVLKISEESRPA